MTLLAPFGISARLLPAVKVGDAWLSLAATARERHGRTLWRYYIDAPTFEHEGCDLSGAGGVQDMMEGLLSFLIAAADSYRHNGLTYSDDPDLNCSLFPRQVVVWAYHNDSELLSLQLELQERKGLVTA